MAIVGYPRIGGHDIPLVAEGQDVAESSEKFAALYLSASCNPQPASSVKKNRTGTERTCTGQDVIELARALARHVPDQTIAAVLNRLGKSPATGIAAPAAASAPYSSIRHRHSSGVSARNAKRQRPMKRRQFCPSARPWTIKHGDLMADSVRVGANARRSRRPQPDDRQQICWIYIYKGMMKAV
jgi:hypothetical protein